MNLTVIGSGNIYSKCNSASYLIDGKILLDIPNGTYKALKKIDIDVNQIEEVLITHFHGDHYFDVPFFILEKTKKNSGNIKIYCDIIGKKQINALMKLAFPNKKNGICSYINDLEFEINKYNIRKVLLEHEEGINDYGYIFKQENKTIGFTGDTALCKNVKKMAEECDYLICDCNSLIGNGHHMGIDNIKELALMYSSCTFYATHLDDSTRRELKKIEIRNIKILNDSDNLVL